MKTVVSGKTEMVLPVSDLQKEKKVSARTIPGLLWTGLFEKLRIYNSCHFVKYPNKKTLEGRREE